MLSYICPECGYQWESFGMRNAVRCGECGWYGPTFKASP